MCVCFQDQEEQAFFAVFDGHGGVDAAIYAANHLHVNMVHQECFSQDPGEALCRAFRVTDERFIRKAKMEVRAQIGIVWTFSFNQMGCGQKLIEIKWNDPIASYNKH